MRKKHISSLNLLWAGLILLVFSSMAHAQYEDGSVVGTIHDTSGADVAGATVTVTNTATGIQNTVTSNGSGDYEVPSVRAGLYRISAAASGFATAIAENITVSVGNRQRIYLTLKPGQATTTVEVSDVALQLETDSSQRGTNLYLPDTISRNAGNNLGNPGNWRYPADFSDHQRRSDQRRPDIEHLGGANRSVWPQSDLLNAPSSRRHLMRAHVAPISFPPGG